MGPARGTGADAAVRLADRNGHRAEGGAGGAAELEGRADEGELVDLVGGERLEVDDLEEQRAALGEQIC